MSETPSNNTQRQNEEGSWTSAVPLPYTGRIARTENWLRQHGMKRAASILARWDERGLGR